MIKNIDYVHSVKRQKIIDGLRFLESKNQNGIITKVILFGSVITDNCTDNSDIDICFVTEYDSHTPLFFEIFGGFPLAMNDLCDIFIYSNVSGKLKDVIDKTGIVIYEYLL